ncbi:unnamed protein product [Rotaria sordida]|uniref:Uncharacterized protein n=1 Tax=Rotaria sordida TaxID=392033 RepID=A0A814KBR5_9BILA|nr:unnamed protein product [Rotaria sordida]CAF1556271.1 unnamed protein product [Rotaria sordida]
MTTIGKKRYYPISNESDDNDNKDISNLNFQSLNKHHSSTTIDFLSPRLIVSERQQLAILKQLTASNDKSNIVLQSSSSIISQQHSTKIHRRNEHGETILHIAARKGDLKQLKKELKDGANVNEEDNAGWTPLHEAVTKNKFKAAHFLLKSGANSNAFGPEGQTPLIDAVLNNNIKMVGLLLNYSADPSIIDLTHVNEPILKNILKGEIPTLDSLENENDDESISRSSSISSSDESEHDIEKIDKHSSNNKISTIDKNLSRKTSYDFESDDNNETIKNHKQQSNSASISDDEHIHHISPFQIISTRIELQNITDTESIILSNMNSNSTMETSTLSIIRQNEKFLSTIIASPEFNDKVINLDEEQEKNDKKQEENNLSLTDKYSSSLGSLDYEKLQSLQTTISTIVDNLITQIDSNINMHTNTSKKQELIKKEKQNDLKQTKRTLRSHAREKLNLSISYQTSNHNQRISNRRRASEKNISFVTNEKFQRKKTISERLNNQIIEHNHNHNIINEDININGNDGNSSNKITINIKQIHNHSDIDSLPPNKRRLRERNTAILNSPDTSTTINSSSTEENIPIESTTRNMPINCIKKFLEIRQQIEKRHETMLHDFVQPKVPKDFAETLMAKKNYLIAPSYKSFSITTPASLGIKRLNPPLDLDSHLSDVFSRQEDERYRMKLRHQVERDKLILSHEQEILRLYGNATRLSIHQDIPLSYCSLLKDNEVYNNPIIQERTSSFINNDYTNTELGKRGKNRWNGRSFIKWLEDSNLKYKRLSCEINQRQHLEANTLYSMQRMVWLKHLPKETSSSGRIHTLLSEHYLPKVEINNNFWTQWEINPI